MGSLQRQEDPRAEDAAVIGFWLFMCVLAICVTVVACNSIAAKKYKNVTTVTENHFHD